VILEVVGEMLSTLWKLGTRAPLGILFEIVVPVYELSIVLARLSLFVFDLCLQEI